MSCRIAACLMVKNESKRIQVTLDSIDGVVDGLIVYDTGSTDDTLAKVKAFSSAPVHLLEGEFENFSVSRNKLLAFANRWKDDYAYFLLMDCNDELQGDLKSELAAHPDATHFLVPQLWQTDYINKYYNIRIIKSGLPFRYQGPVHEYLELTTTPSSSSAAAVKLTHTSLFQDRRQEDTKSELRWNRDLDLLLQEYTRDPNDPRTVFYLAQTYGCLQRYSEAYRYYKLRLGLEGFYEERFIAMERCGDYSQQDDKKVRWYLRAFDLIERVEPLLKIVEVYKAKRKFKVAYAFLTLACELPFPDTCILFVDRTAYDYKRWHLMGIIAYYVGKYAEGIEGCQKAIAAGINVPLDTSNLAFYQCRRSRSNKGKEEEEEEFNHANEKWQQNY